MVTVFFTAIYSWFKKGKKKKGQLHFRLFFVMQ